MPQTSKSFVWKRKLLSQTETDELINLEFTRVAGWFADLTQLSLKQEA
jgi:hypothetical protein